VSDTATPLLCPKCSSDIGAQVETKRTVSFRPDTDSSYQGLWAETASVLWEHPYNEDGSECNDTHCGDPDCDSVHNFDAQKNKELLTGSTPLEFIYDWEYLEEEDEEVIRVTKLRCTNYSCDWTMVLSEEITRVTMSSVDE
jgi:hypothetical protein